jgi:hypothetical protein
MNLQGAQLPNGALFFEQMLPLESQRHYSQGVWRIDAH